MSIFVVTTKVKWRNEKPKHQSSWCPGHYTNLVLSFSAILLEMCWYAHDSQPFNCPVWVTIQLSDRCLETKKSNSELLML